MTTSSSNATYCTPEIVELNQLLSAISSDSSDPVYRVFFLPNDNQHPRIGLHSVDVGVALRYKFPEEYDGRRRRDICLQVIRAIASSLVVHEVLYVDKESSQQTDLMMHVAEMLCVNTSVKFLQLTGLMDMNLDSAALMASALSNNHTLHTLVLDFHEQYDALDDAEVVKVLLAPFVGIHASASNHALHCLIMRDAKLGDEGAKQVANMLRTNSSIRQLRLVNCHIKCAGAAAIGMSLAFNNTLEELHLESNFIGAEGLEALLQPLSCHHHANKQQLNTSFKALRTGTDIGSRGMSALANMLRNNSTLSQLQLRGLNSASEEDICSLFKSLTRNTSLEELDLFCSESVAGEKVFATIQDLLGSNLSLKSLNICGTPLAREGKGAVIKAQMESEVRREQAALLKDMQVVTPKAARVFLCGDPFAGKTTLHKSMIRGMAHPTIKMGSSCLNLISRPFKDWLLHESELRTQGVEVEFLAIGDTHLTIWDMAGQKEFHSFHDLVVPNLSGGGSSSLFLLVCNPFDNSMNIKHDEDIKKELRYWMQFIASNTRRSEIFRPHVIIVVTHADQSNIDLIFPMIEEFTMNELRRDFDSVIKVDLYDNPLDARSISRVHQFVEKLKNDLVSMLEDLPKVFVACVEMQLHIDKWNKKYPKRPLILWDEFVDLCKNKSIYKKRDHEDSQNIEERFYKVIAASLHEAGQVLYFEELEFVVVNPNWFCHKIMGKLIKGPLVSSPTNGFICKGVFKKFISRSFSPNRSFCSRDVECKVEPEHLAKIMVKLKLLYEDPKDENKIFIPATLKDENENFNMHQWLPCKDPVYIGRRLQCSDKIRTSLTLGFFPRLQVSFYEKFGPLNPNATGYTLAQNTIEFFYNGMEIKLQYTSEIGFDIDIFVQSRKSKEVTLEFVQKNIINHIIDLCVDKILGCQGVILVEGILRPECVMRLTPCKYRKQQSVLVETLKQKVLTTADLCYIHSWERESDILNNGFDKAMDLLGEHEWDDVLNKFHNNLKDVYGLFSSKHKSIIEELDSSSSIQKASSSKVEPSILGISKFLEEMDAHIREIHADINRIGKAEEKLLKKTKDILDLMDHLKLELFSKVDHVIDFSWQLQSHVIPRYVYFTTTDVPSGVHTIVTKLISGIKSVQLHFMCEHKYGFHKVDGQEGITLTLTTKRTHKILPILKWSLKIITLLIKVGAHMATGLGSMIPMLDKIIIYGLDAGALDQVALGVVDDNNGVQKDEVDITDQHKKVATEWLIKLLGENPRIAKLFGLYKIKYNEGNEVAWVCKEHMHQGMTL